MMLPITLALILGLGACSTAGDWCPRVVGKIGVEAELYTQGSHSITGRAMHMSDSTDGTFFTSRKGDRGIEVYSVEYRYKIGAKP